MENIFHRISVRRFEDRPVEREKTKAILRAAMQAPSAANQQPWKFYVVTDRKKIAQLSETKDHYQIRKHCLYQRLPGGG